MKGLLVVIPCFNAAASLERSLASALAQKVDPLKIVIVDDASTDESLALAHNLAARDDRVSVLSMPVNSGPGAARNLGARSQPSRYLAFLDADDEYLPHALPSALNVLDKDARWDAIKFGFETEPRIDLAPAHYDITYNSIPSNLVLKRYVFDVLGGFPEDAVFRSKLAGEDVAFYEGIQRLFHLARAQDRLLRYNCPPGSHLFRMMEDCPLDETGQAIFPQTPEREELGRAIGRYITQGRERMRLAARLWSEAGCPVPKDAP
ncbi:MAG: glycosyltransferase family 2 protein [Alphaproteobacteria bacterium]|nr:glycosyltransferase family 2 protein [Alphaproteobacteria bacterium]